MFHQFIIIMSTHTGRRSFICNALGMGISPQVFDEIDWQLRLQGHEAIYPDSSDDTIKQEEVPSRFHSFCQFDIFFFKLLVYSEKICTFAK